MDSPKHKFQEKKPDRKSTHRESVCRKLKWQAKPNYGVIRQDVDNFESLASRRLLMCYFLIWGVDKLVYHFVKSLTLMICVLFSMYFMLQ